jgi:hypothetical protein
MIVVFPRALPSAIAFHAFSVFFRPLADSLNHILSLESQPIDGQANPKNPSAAPRRVFDLERGDFHVR